MTLNLELLFLWIYINWTELCGVERVDRHLPLGGVGGEVVLKNLSRENSFFLLSRLPRLSSHPIDHYFPSVLWPGLDWVLLHLVVRWISLYSHNKGVTTRRILNPELSLSRKTLRFADCRNGSKSGREDKEGTLPVSEKIQILTFNWPWSKIPLEL